MNSLLVKQKKPHIDPDNPWMDDVFERKSSGERLTRLIENTPDNFVLAVKAPFGAGKTVFLERLSKHLNKTMPVITLDAWENDFLDPLEALLVALNNRVKTISDPSIKEVALDKVKKIIAHLPKTLKFGARAALAIKTLGASELMVGMYDVATDIANSDTTAVDAGLDLLKLAEENDSNRSNFSKRLQELRTELLKSFEPKNENGKLVFIIDELDRCRPDFSIKMLERIKHFFNEPGITFILALDNDNLGSAVQTLYGPNADGERYLRKFFDMEFFLPPASPQAIVINLMIQHGHVKSEGNASLRFTTLKDDVQLERQLPQHLAGRKGHYDHVDIPSFTIALTDLSIVYSLSIRDLIQIMTALTAVIRTAEYNKPLLPYILCLGIVCRFADPRGFTNIVTGEKGLSRWYAANGKSIGEKLPNSTTAQFLATYLKFGSMSYEDIHKELNRHDWEPYDNTRVRIKNEFYNTLSFLSGNKSFDEYICKLLNIAGSFIAPSEER